MFPNSLFHDPSQNRPSPRSLKRLVRASRPRLKACFRACGPADRWNSLFHELLIDTSLQGLRASKARRFKRPDPSQCFLIHLSTTPFSRTLQAAPQGLLQQQIEGNAGPADRGKRNANSLPQARPSPQPEALPWTSQTVGPSPDSLFQQKRPSPRSLKRLVKASRLPDPSGHASGLLQGLAGQQIEGNACGPHAPEFKCATYLPDRIQHQTWVQGTADTGGVPKAPG